MNQKLSKIVALAIDGLLFSGVVYGSVSQTVPVPTTPGFILQASSTAIGSSTWVNVNSLGLQTNITFPIPVASTSLAAGNNLILNGNTLSWNASPSTSTITTVTSTLANITTLRFPDATKFTTAAQTISGTFLNATTTQTSNSKLISPARTITSFYCNTSGASITAWADERATTTPNTAGSAIFSGTGIVCDSDGTLTTSFNDANLAANSLLNVFASSTPNATTTLNFTFTMKETN